MAGPESLGSLIRFYSDHSIEKIYIKPLAPNDNSKNQVYFGSGFDALTLFPTGAIYPASTKKEPIFKAPLDFYWIGDNSSLVRAPTAQLILYPQYPEVRFSGYLSGADRLHLGSIRTLMTSRTPGRYLFLGVHDDGYIVASVFGPDSPIVRELLAQFGALSKTTGSFYELVPSVFLGIGADPRTALLKELCRIHRLDWIDSKRLDKTGCILDCTSSQCGGYTLEAELGITPNGRSEPDYMGWEVKQHGGNVLTLMTPEPTGGFYVERGVEEFVRTFGYIDKMGREDRMNFGGTHFCNKRHASTGLTLSLQGYDHDKRMITDAEGGIALSHDDGTITAFWAFSGILEHWNRKHRNAVYVPSEHRKEPQNQYRYGDSVQLGVGTDPLYLLKAIQTQAIYYDPGIKLVGLSSAKPETKKRSQFRVKLKDLSTLYESWEKVDVTTYCN